MCVAVKVIHTHFEVSDAALILKNTDLASDATAFAYEKDESNVEIEKVRLSHFRHKINMNFFE